MNNQDKSQGSIQTILIRGIIHGQLMTIHVQRQSIHNYPILNRMRISE